MIYINAAQGSDAWKAERSAPNTFTASELPAADGKSQFMSRAKLLKMKQSGIAEEVDSFTQSRFNKGHETEFAARPLAEEIIGDELSPVTGYVEVDGMRLLASLDGITFDGDVLFEHKLYSEALAAQVIAQTLEPHYTLQLDQQLLVSGAKKVLFMTSDGTKTNMVWMWYERPTDLSHVVSIWKQFAKDLAEYSPAAEAEKVTATAVMALPSLSVTIKGEVTNSNLPVFICEADKFLAGIKTELKDDQDFADAESNVKACKAAEDGIEAAKKAITAQATTIDEVMRTMDLYKEKLSTVRLKLDKLVKSEKVARKEAIAASARTKFAEHLAKLEAEIKPIRMHATVPDFAGVMSGLKKLSAMQEAVDTALRDSIYALDTMATDYRQKLSWCKENAAGMSALFPDLQALMLKPLEDFTLTITSRIDANKKAEAEKMEAVRVQAEAAARAKLEAEAKAKEEAEARAKEVAAQLVLDDLARRAAESPAFIAKQAAVEEALNSTGIAMVDGDKVYSGRDIRIPLSAQPVDDVEARRRAVQLADLKKALAGKYPPAMEMVSITKAEYDRLVERDDWLGWLEAAGVDNWQGMDEAISMRNEAKEAA